MLNIWNWAAYPKAVEMDGSRSLADCVETLSRMTRTSLWFRRKEKRPFLGVVSDEGGRLLYSPNFNRILPRSLEFALTESETGTRLHGELKVILPTRIFTAFYFIFAIFGSLIGIGFSVHYATEISWTYELRLLAQGFVCAFIFMFGFNGLGVVLSRRTERQGLAIIRHVMNHNAAEDIVLDLLGS